MKTYKQLQERINMAKAKMGDVIKDFMDSDAPQFKSKSDEKRRQMAIAAKLSNEEIEQTDEGYHVMRNGQSISYHQDKESADKRASASNMRGGSNATVVKDERGVKEEVETIDEISSDMANRYLKGKHERDYNTSADGKSSSLKKPQSFAKMNKDMMGSMRALKTIERAKKANEEVEQTDEELKGDQHKIDANKNGKVDGHDFKLLRAKKK